MLLRLVRVGDVARADAMTTMLTIALPAKISPDFKERDEVEALLRRFFE